MIDGIKKEYLDRMKVQLGVSYDSYIKSFDEEESHGLLLNKNKLASSSIDLDYIIKMFDAKLIFENPNLAYLTYDKYELDKKNIQVGKSPFHHAGLYYIMEPSAARVLSGDIIESDDIVLDMCASPGGKSIMASCNLDRNKGGMILSNEIDYGRAKILKSNIERMGFDNVVVTCNKADDLNDNFIDFFDKIILDAPCSGEGMMRKSKDARLQWSTNLVKSMSSIQKSLIDSAYSMLKCGGLLIYSTCTFSIEEDEEVVSYACDKYSDLIVVESKKLFPFNSLGEGQFYAILKKGSSNGKNHSVLDDRMFDGLNILKNGVEKYEKKYNITLPTHESTHVDSIYFENNYELNDDEVIKYLHGDIIRSENNIKDGYYKMTYKKLGIGLAKAVSNVLKNHYPKGLRNL